MFLHWTAASALVASRELQDPSSWRDLEKESLVLIVHCIAELVVLAI